MRPRRSNFAEHVRLIRVTEGCIGIHRVFRPRCHWTHESPGPITALSCSFAPSTFQRQRADRFFIERFAVRKLTLERLRIEKGFECSEQLCASALCVLAPPGLARVAEQGRRRRIALLLKCGRIRQCISVAAQPRAALAES